MDNLGVVQRRCDRYHGNMQCASIGHGRNRLKFDLVTLYLGFNNRCSLQLNPRWSGQMDHPNSYIRARMSHREILPTFESKEDILAKFTE